MGVVSALLPLTAQANPGDAAMAQSLFEAALALVDQGRLPEACPKFAESNRLDPSAGTLLNLGKCHEADGKFASAWAAYNQAVAVGRAKGQTRHVEAAEGFLAQVVPRLSHLTVSVPNATEGLSVTANELRINPASFDVPIALDPKRYRVLAEAPGHEPFEVVVEIGSSSGSHRVVVPLLSPRQLSEQPIQPQHDGSPPALFWVGLGAGALGATLMAVGGGFGIATLHGASAAREDAALCPDMECSESGWVRVGELREQAFTSEVLLGVGGGLLGAGVAMIGLGYLLEAGDASTTAWITPTRHGLLLGAGGVF